MEEWSVRRSALGSVRPCAPAATSSLQFTEHARPAERAQGVADAGYCSEAWHARRGHSL